MKKITIGIILILIIILPGCFKTEEAGYEIEDIRVEFEEGKTVVYSLKEVDGIEILLNGNTEGTIEVNNKYLKIEKAIKGNTLIAIAKIGEGIEKGEEIFRANRKIKKEQILEVNSKRLEETNESNRIDEETQTDDLCKLLGDFSGNNEVCLIDFISFVDHYNSEEGDGVYEVEYDIAPAEKGTGVWSDIYALCTPDGEIKLMDFIIFAENYGEMKPNEPPLVEKQEGPDEMSYKLDITFKWSGSDPDNDLDYYEYRKDNSEWNKTVNNQYTWYSITEGDHTFEVRAMDTKGLYSNIIDWTFNVKKDCSICIKDNYEDNLAGYFNFERYNLPIIKTVEYNKTVTFSVVDVQEMDKSEIVEEIDTRFSFVKWKDENYSNERTKRITSDSTYTAIFEKFNKVVSGIETIQNEMPEKKGRITKEPKIKHVKNAIKIITPQGATITDTNWFQSNAEYTFEATSLENHVFSYWKIDNTLIENNNPLTIVIDTPKKIIAYYEYIVAPAAPSDLTIKEYSNNTITLEWKDNATDEDAYVVERKEEGSNYKTIETLDKNITSYTDRYLNSGTTYSYIVYSSKLGRLSGPSNEITQKTNSNPQITSTSPENNFTVLPNSTIILTWDATDIDGDSLLYDIYFGAKENPPLILENADKNEHTINDLEPKSKYYWKIVAKDDHKGIDETSVKIIVTEEMPFIEWEKFYGGSRADVIGNMVELENGNWVIGATSKSEDGDVLNHISGYDAWIFEIAESGEILWQKTYGGSNDDYVVGFIKTMDDYLWFGNTDSPDIGNYTDGFDNDWYLAKIDKLGNLSWQDSYGGTDEERIKNILKTTDGNYLLIGNTGSNDGDVEEYMDLQDWWIVKVNQNGGILWNKTYGSYEFDRLENGINTSDGGYLLVGGSVYDNPTRSIYFQITKINSSGSIQWQKKYGGSEYDVLLDCYEDSVGNYFVIGTTESNDGDIVGNHGGQDVCVMKLSSNGTLVWIKCYGGSGDEADDLRLYSCESNNEGLVIIAETESSDGDISENFGDSQIWLLNIDWDGNILGEKSIEDCDIRFIKPYEDGYLIGGRKNDDAWFAKIREIPQNYIYKNEPPKPASVIYPEDDSIDVPLIMKLKWECTDPNGDELKYDIYLGEQSNPPLVKSDYSEKTYEPLNIQPNKIYYWKIVAKDPEGLTSESPTWEFTSGDRAGLLWDNKYNGSSISGPAIAETGEIFMMHEAGYLMCYKYDSNDEIWEIRVDNSTTSEPAIDNNGNVYFADEAGILYSYDYINKTMNWKYQLDSGVYRGSPSISDDGRIYVADKGGYLYSINPNKSLNWKKYVGVYPSSPAISRNGNIYIGSQEYIKGFTSSGNLVFEYVTDTDGPVIINENGDLYFTDNEEIICMLPNGEIKERYKFDNSDDIDCSPIIKDNVLYFGTDNNKFYAFDLQTESILWSYVTENPVECTPVLSSNGRIYFADKEGVVYCVDTQGNLKWKHNTSPKESFQETYPAIDDKGNIYFATSSGIYVFYDIDNTSLVEGTWVKFKQNNQNTGVGNDSSSFDRTLTVQAKDESQKCYDSRFELYNKDGYLKETKLCDSNGIAEFSGLYPAGYYCLVYNQKDSTMFNDEYWGDTSVSVEDGDRDITIYREMPRIFEISDVSGYTVGDTIYPRVTVENDQIDSENVRVTILIDDDQQAPYLYEYTSPISQIGLYDKEFVGDSYVLQEGVSIYCIVETYVQGLPSGIFEETRWRTTDEKGWILLSGEPQPGSCTITFDTDPEGVGTINFDGTDYFDGDEITVEVGTYPIDAYLSNSYEFVEWAANGDIAVDNIHSQNTTCYINGDVQLSLVQNAKPILIKKSGPDDVIKWYQMAIKENLLKFYFSFEDIDGEVKKIFYKNNQKVWVELNPSLFSNPDNACIVERLDWIKLGTNCFYIKVVDDKGAASVITWEYNVSNDAKLDLEGPIYEGKVLFVVNKNPDPGNVQSTGYLPSSAPSYDSFEVIEKQTGGFIDFVYPYIEETSGLHYVEPEEYIVGERKEFYVSDDSHVLPYKIEAELVVKGNKCGIWVDLNELGSVKLSTVKELAYEFDTKIYDKVTNYFASPSDINNDGIINIMLYDIPSPANKTVCGYFREADLKSILYSNKMEILYINSQLDIDNLKSTTAHEFQHLVNFVQNVLVEGNNSMDLWLNEGLSMGAEHLFYGTQLSRFYPFTDDNKIDIRDGASVYEWSSELYNYALSYVYVQYLKTQAGGPFIYKELIDNAYGDYRAVESIINKYITTSSDIKDFTQNFHLARFLNQGDGVYCLSNDEGFEFLFGQFSDLSGNVELKGGGALFIEISGSFQEPSNHGADISYVGIDLP